jgi:hypothetical protein
MAHHNSDLSQQADSRRRLLAADPFPPLAPPTLDAATAGSAEFDVTVPWPAAELEPLPTGQAGADAHGLGTSRPAPDPFAAAPLPFAAAPLPSAGTP